MQQPDDAAAQRSVLEYVVSNLIERSQLKLTTLEDFFCQRSAPDGGK